MSFICACSTLPSDWMDAVGRVQCHLWGRNKGSIQVNDKLIPENGHKKLCCKIHVFRVTEQTSLVNGPVSVTACCWGLHRPNLLSQTSTFNNMYMCVYVFICLLYWYFSPYLWGGSQSNFTFIWLSLKIISIFRKRKAETKKKSVKYWSLCLGHGLSLIYLENWKNAVNRRLRPRAVSLWTVLQHVSWTILPSR